MQEYISYGRNVNNETDTAKDKFKSFAYYFCRYIDITCGINVNINQVMFQDMF